jgi:hypothetical protein
MPKQKWLRMYRLTLLVVFATFLLPFPSNGQESSSLLTYSLTAKPGNLQVNRMPGTNPPRSYQETFSFVVKDTKRTDYKGSAASCKTFDVEVAPIDTPDQPVWVWSKGQKFCQHVTTVNIPAGQSWPKTAVWKFTTADVKDGKYRATATFIPENGKTSVDFEITSVQ